MICKISYRSILLFFHQCAYAQLQWRFYVTFEDGTGQRDTLWMVYDTTATFNVDSALGESKVVMNNSVFNVWIFNASGDSTKTEAVPYTNFPMHALNNIQAFNFQYPITIAWDTSLFHTSVLPSHATSFINKAVIENDYFWSNNNDPPLQAFNMLIDNHVDAPSFNWGSQSHFPMMIHFEYLPVGLNELNGYIRTTVFPNPAQNYINVSTSFAIENLVITNVQGVKVKYIPGTLISNLIQNRFDVSDLEPGIYACIFYYSDQTYQKSYFIKSDLFLTE